MNIELNLHYDDENNARWLAVSGERKTIVYDLQSIGNDGTPIELSSFLRRSVISGGVWPINWTTIISCTDDIYLRK